MAQAPKPMQADTVRQWKDLTLNFIRDIAEYAGGNSYNADTEANIRELRMLCQSFLAALQSAPSFPPSPPQG